MLIAYRDYVKDATLDELSVGGWEAGSPLDNVKDRRLAVAALADDTKYRSIRATFSAVKTIGFVAILDHNLEQNSTYAITFLDVSSTPIAAYGTGIWAPQPDVNFPKNILVVTTPPTDNVKYVRINLIPPAGVGGDFATPISIGRVWAGLAWEPEYETSRESFTIKTRDESVVSKSVGNQVYVDERPRYRQLTCRLPMLSEEEAIGNITGTAQNLQDVAFECGRGGEVIVIPNSSGLQVIHKFGIYGRFVEPPSVDLIPGGKGRVYSSTFDVVEDL